MASRSPAFKSVEELIKDCKKACKEKQWNVALALVSAALQSPDCRETHSRMAALDLLTAVHLKMGELDLALKDAKAMVRLDRTDGRGYLRCAQMERLMGHQSAAAAYYEHGLKNVPSSHGHFQTLTRELDCAKDQIRIETIGSKATDPVVVLPIEVVEMIFSFLSYRQHVRALRVSKAWSRILSSLRPLIDTLAFPGATKEITEQMMYAAQRRLTVPRTINVGDLPAKPAMALYMALGHWENFTSLQHLLVNNLLLRPAALPVAKYKLKRLMMGNCAVIPFHSVMTLLQACPGLEVARFENVSNNKPELVNAKYTDTVLESENLQHLEIRTDDFSFNPDKFFSRMPRLKVLACTGFRCPGVTYSQQTLDLRHMGQLETLELNGYSGLELSLPPSLKILHLTRCNFMPESADEPEGPFAVLQNLEVLLIEHCIGLPLFLMRHAVQTKAGKLEEFLLTTRQFAGSMFTHMMMLDWLQGVKRLRLQGVALSDDESHLFVERFPKLEELALEEVPITGAFISDVKKGLGDQLRKILLVMCPRVSSDIVPWAKARGVEIDLIRGAQDTSGRRVRNAH